MLATERVNWRVGGMDIISDVDLEVREGEFLSVIGPNGAGKSTLIGLLSGTIRPTAGAVRLRDRDVTRWSPARRARLGLGRTFQTSSLFPALTVLENCRISAQAALGHSLSLLRRPHPDDEASRRGMRMLEQVGLADRANRPVAALSHGDKRKLEIAVVLSADPAVVLLDEPTAGVSAEDVDGLIEVVRRLHADGRTIVMVEHHLDLVRDLSDRVAVMHQGRMLICDVLDRVLADAEVRRAYLGDEIAMGGAA